MKIFHIQNVRLVDADTDRTGDVWLVDGGLRHSQPANVAVPDFEVIDGTGKILMPGLVDPHVHFRTPGFEQKETFATGTAAAAAGGVTAVLDMPNTIPPTYSLDALKSKRAIVGPQARVRWGLIFGAGADNADAMAAAQNIPAMKLYCNTTTGDLKTEDRAVWERILKIGRRVVTHAEGETWQKLTELWLELGQPCELHLAHASLKIEVDRVRELKKISSKISAEACPHHLLLTDVDERAQGNFARMKPPLATEADRLAIWEAVADGTIDFFATDHAPHTRVEKSGDTSVWGIPGVGERFSLLWTEWQRRGWDVQNFVKMNTTEALRQNHITDPIGTLGEGAAADVILVDPDAEFQISVADTPGKSDWSPFDGRTVRGKVLSTWVAGHRVWDGSKIDESFAAPELQFELEKDGTRQSSNSKR